jgi:hypothetical protein
MKRIDPRVVAMAVRRHRLATAGSKDPGAPPRLLIRAGPFPSLARSRTRTGQTPVFERSSVGRYCNEP